MFSPFQYFKVSDSPLVQRASVSLFVTWSFVVSYFAFLIIVSPLMLKDIVGEQEAAAWQGTLTSLTAASGLFLCGAVGYLSDRYGSRLPFMRIWCVCFLCASVFVLHSELARTLTGLVFARLVPFSVMNTLSYALASDIAKDSSEVLRAHQALGATFSLAMLAGNVFAGGMTLLFAGRAWILLLGCGLTSTAVWCSFNYLESPAREPTTSTFSSPTLLVTGGSSPAVSSSAAAAGAEIGGLTVADSANMKRSASSNTAGFASTNKDRNSDNDSDSDAGKAAVAVAVPTGRKNASGALAAGFPPIASPVGVPDKLPDPSDVSQSSPTTSSAGEGGAGAPSSSITIAEGIALLKRDPLLRNLIVAFALLRVSNVNGFAIFILYTAHRFGWTLVHVSCYLVALGCVGAVAQAAFLRVMNSLSERVARGEMTGAAAGNVVLQTFFVLLGLSVPTCIYYGLAGSTPALLLVTIPAGLCAVIPGIFTAKIAHVSKESNLTGWSLGLVGTTQNLIESMLGVVFGLLLRHALRTYAVDDWMIGLPYFVNGASYLLVCVLVYWSHTRYGVARSAWTHFEVDASLLQQAHQAQQTAHQESAPHAA